MPRVAATAAAWVRDATPSLLMIEVMWDLTVRTSIPSSRATALFGFAGRGQAQHLDLARCQGFVRGRLSAMRCATDRDKWRRPRATAVTPSITSASGPPSRT